MSGREEGPGRGLGAARARAPRAPWRARRRLAERGARGVGAAGAAGGGGAPGAVAAGGAAVGGQGQPNLLDRRRVRAQRARGEVQNVAADGGGLPVREVRRVHVVGRRLAAHRERRLLLVEARRPPELDDEPLGLVGVRGRELHLDDVLEVELHLPHDREVEHLPHQFPFTPVERQEHMLVALRNQIPRADRQPRDGDVRRLRELGGVARARAEAADVVARERGHASLGAVRRWPPGARGVPLALLCSSQ